MLYKKYIKRVFDIAGAVVGLILLSPLLATCALLVRMNGGGGVIFQQHRPGRGGHLFTIFKFRSMRENFATQDDDRHRLTPLGRMLRATSLDELPELWNVLRGDMSLVGPRPLLPQYLPRYTPTQARRHEIRPGITGWAQVNGRNAITWEQKFQLDVWYVDNLSLRLDLCILWRTFVTVLFRRGINHPGAATAPEFMGEVEG